MATDQEERPLDDQLLVRHDDGVLWLTLNRPEAANAVTPAQRNRLIELLADASEQADVRVVVLGANGKHFCTGADLRSSSSASAARVGQERPDGAPDRVVGDVARMLRRGAQRLVAGVLDCEKPVIAAVNGTAAGLGAHLALASDLVIASDNARFIEVFVRRGLVPDAGGAWLLPRLVGLQRAKELMFFGDDVPAARAEQLGLVNRVVPADALDDTVAEWAKRLAAAPTQSIGMAKRLVNRSLDVDRATAFEEEAVAQELNMGTHDAGEGVRSFVERRDPNFRGW
jgi:2-(1,2-epoxy-1,2-dihydrophenyl)acetyl-CoA isomerase